ncbi:hypothetical protein DFH08DRAFT_1087139 [Mycena albidolilacea]|uniref:Uncharacterized protein n=1 Tax=Mycena albidolilacea TaxID=1033008 RepID=A0AAD6ZBV3_9AGAR|nr:hypothetical protein DFH08DRAFT_1087139 [Mycena albidolilacea]
MGLIRIQACCKWVAKQGVDIRLIYRESKTTHWPGQQLDIHARRPATSVSILDNWYRRPFLDEYNAKHLITDMLTMWTRYPELLFIGGNTNSVNTCASIDIRNLTGGVYNAESLLEGDNAACFVFEAVQILVPDALSRLAGIGGVILTKLLSVTAILAGLTRPDLVDINRSILGRYPGYRQMSHAV